MRDSLAGISRGLTFSIYLQPPKLAPGTFKNQPWDFISYTESHKADQTIWNLPQSPCLSPQSTRLTGMNHYIRFLEIFPFKRDPLFSIDKSYKNSFKYAYKWKMFEILKILEVNGFQRFWELAYEGLLLLFPSSACLEGRVAGAIWSLWGSVDGEGRWQIWAP